jgi:hypothetical protein
MTTLILFLLFLSVCAVGLFLLIRSATKIYAGVVAYNKSFRKETKDQFRASFAIVIILLAGAAAVLLLAGNDEISIPSRDSVDASASAAIQRVPRVSERSSRSSSASGSTFPVPDVGQTGTLNNARSPGDFAIMCPLDGNLLIVRSQAVLRFLPGSGVAASHDRNQAIIAYSTAQEVVKGCVRNMHASIQPDATSDRAFFYYVDSNGPSVFVEQNGMLDARNFDIPRGQTSCETLDFFEARTLLVRHLMADQKALLR